MMTLNGSAYVNKISTVSYTMLLDLVGFFLNTTMFQPNCNAVNYSVKIYKNNQSVSVNESELLNTTSGCSPQFSWLRNRLDVAVNNIVTIIGTNFTAVITAQNSSNNVTMFNGMRPQIVLP
jgi:hypothetical protein